MSPLEHAIRAACSFIGTDPETWHGFKGIGHAAIEAFIGALPADLASAIKAHLDTHHGGLT